MGGGGGGSGSWFGLMDQVVTPAVTAELSEDDSAILQAGARASELLADAQSQIIALACRLSVEATISDNSGEADSSDLAGIIKSASSIGARVEIVVTHPEIE